MGPVLRFAEWCGRAYLDHALSLRLRPVADALKRVFEPSLMHTLAELSELMDIGSDRDAHLLKSSTIHHKRQEFFTTITDHACTFFHEASRAYKDEHKQPPVRREPLDSQDTAIRFRRNLRHTMNLPHQEDSFAAGWSSEARRVLPSRSPRVDATAVWAPVLGWCLVESLADAMEAAGKPEEQDAKHSEGPAATEIFDQLRLRSWFAEAFSALGVEGEDGWRAAARVRVALLPEATEKRTPRDWWDDLDVRWLTGLHAAGGAEYFNKESYEQIVWWRILPELMSAPADPAAFRLLAVDLERRVRDAISAARNAQYRLDLLLQDPKAKDAIRDSTESVEPQKVKQSDSAELTQKER